MRPAHEIRGELDQLRQLVRAEAICKLHGVTLDQALGGARHKEFCRARQAIYLALSEAGEGYSRIARLFGVDHTTVQHGVRAAKRRRVELGAAPVETEAAC